jgi:mono/diheme cytochrome c family protein
MFSRAFPAVMLALIACASINAQQGAPQSRTVWDGAYTDDQAERARTTFDNRCAQCHTLGPEGGAGNGGAANGGPLSGDKFWTLFTQRSVGYLLNFVKKNMPNGAAAGSLPPETYNDLVALILKANGFPAGQAEVTPETVADIQIIPKDGPGELPARVLARVVGCLARGDGGDWVVTRATDPERIDEVGAGPTDATRPLGTRSITLKFGLTNLNRLVDQRVSVSGMLIGAGGIGGINVSDVTRVAGDCQ